MDSIPVDSILVIPWPFQNPPEFHGMEITILAGSTAKIPFHGIPGIIRIPADSGRNTWVTVKNSHLHWLHCPSLLPCILSLSSVAVFFAFFAFFAFGLLAISSAFDGPRFQIFEVGGGEAAGFLMTAAGFLQGGMVWKCSVGRDLGGSWGKWGMDPLTWHLEGLEVLWVWNFTRQAVCVVTWHIEVAANKF